MYQYKGLEDTIVAIATPMGKSSIGLIRLSGIDAIKIVDRVFKAKSNKSLSKQLTYTVHYGWIIDDNDEIDEVLVTLMRGPKSFTCEDVVEISCHGGRAAIEAILDLLVREGARLAEPGEFTKRAFLNGRIDLVQAEAVLDIIHSKTESFLQVSNNQLKGSLSTALEKMRTTLMSIYTECEAIVNFPEDEIDANTLAQIKENLLRQLAQVDGLLATSREGKILKDGLKIVICGKPNVGKSTLLNHFLRQPRAIVSAIAGTTRDTLEEQAQLKGIPLNFVDTAGLLAPRDEIEVEAIKRSEQHIKMADVILWVLDLSRPFDEEDQKVFSFIEPEKTILIFNKMDLTRQLNQEDLPAEVQSQDCISISVKEQQQLNDLEDLLLSKIKHQDDAIHDQIILSNARHIQSLQQAKEKLERSLASFDQQLSLEFVSEDVKSAVNDLDAITGRNIDTDLLDQIFSQFCIGK